MRHIFKRMKEHGSLVVLIATMVCATLTFSIAEAKSPSTGSSDHSTEYKHDTAKLNHALGMNNIARASKVLNELEGSTNTGLLLKLASLRLDQKSPFFDGEVGVKLAKRILDSKNETNHGEAALLLGVHFHKHPGFHDRTQAIHWYRKAADQNINHAHIELGKLLQSVPNNENLKAALYHYEAGARLVTAAPLYSFLRKVEQLTAEGRNCGIDPLEVAGIHLSSLIAEAEAGDSVAAKELGRLYLRGTAVSRNLSAATKWLQVSATTGDTGALRDLAKIHLRYNADPQAHKTAIKLLNISSQKGSGAAYAMLAKLYLEQNREETDQHAFELYRKAIDIGYDVELQELKEVYEGEVLLGKNLFRAQQLADLIYEISSKARSYASPAQSTTIANSSIPQGVDSLTVGSITPENSYFELPGYKTGSCGFQNHDQ
ncbi:MAG: tetratricopeptide repeat protein [Rhizobiaceae bacterium]|nr:tetratricopeptide repeat protein [Rhizobiaceae bacterium]